MSSKNDVILENVRLGKFVHGGQAMSQLPDGKTVFVWGGLPGELVDIQVTKKKKTHLEGIVTLVHESSIDRIEPEEPLSYLSTSPWQIVEWNAENKAKQEILEETFLRENISNIKFSPFVASASGRAAHGRIHSDPGAMRNPEGVSHVAKGKGATREQRIYSGVPRDEKDLGFSHAGYRNKIEIGFWGDDEGLHYAHYVRGSHGKQITTSNSLALPAINSASADFLTTLRAYAHKHSVRAGDLKTVVFRCSQDGLVVAALFVKDRNMDFSDLEIPKTIQGVVIYYSNPKSPASIPTKKIYSYGDITLQDKIENINITYDVLSFFQVNIPVFSTVIKAIKRSFTTFPLHVENFKIVDMYSGVGSIGLAVGAEVLVESDPANVYMAKQNVGTRDIEVINASSESALDQIVTNSVIIVDPPRAGLHRDVVDRILDQLPQKVIYLSCNPSTQARDIRLLSEKYKISFAQGYNFFPRTPHIESLVVLDLLPNKFMV